MTVIREEQVLGIIRQLGIVRPSDLEARGISRSWLYNLVKQGFVERHSRGIYVASRYPFSADHTLAHVATRVPGGVFCLLTALRFHGLTTQSPAEVWFALPERARKPTLDYPRLRVARFSGPALDEGIETRRGEHFARICRVTRVMQPYLDSIA